MTDSLATNAEALGQVLASIPGFVVVVGLDGCIRYVNRLEPGYEMSQVLGTPAENLMSGESRTIFATSLENVIETGVGTTYELEVPTPEGGISWYESNMYPYHSGTAIVGVVIMATNITELKAARDELAKLRQLLPVCAWCDQIQDEDGSWDTVEGYLARRLDTNLTHGICPACYQRELDGEGRQAGGS